MELEFSEIRFRKRSAVSAEPKICAGCRTCQVVCSLTHSGSIDLGRSRILIKQNPFKGQFIPMLCHQCADVPCYYACPESAIELEKIWGTVVINVARCTGCKVCEDACPFKVIRFDQESNKAFMCDFCHGEPECVKWCPMNALGRTDFGGEGSS